MNTLVKWIVLFIVSVKSADIGLSDDKWPQLIINMKYRFLAILGNKFSRRKSHSAQFFLTLLYIEVSKHKIIMFNQLESLLFLLCFV